MDKIIKSIDSKIVITDNDIQFISFFYTVIIPKNSDIKFTFYDYRKYIGTPLEVSLDSNQIEIKSKFGFIGQFIYELEPYLGIILNALSRKHISFPGPKSRNKSIRGTETIGIFFKTLKEKGYSTQDAFDNYNELISLDIPKQFTITPSTIIQKAKFLKYSVIGIILVPILVIFLSVSTSTPLLWIVYALSPFVLVFVIGFLYTLISYIYLLIKSHKN